MKFRKNKDKKDDFYYLKFSDDGLYNGGIIKSILDRGFEDVNNLYSSDFMIYLLSTSMGLDPVKDKNLLDKLLDMIKLINSNTKDMLYLSVFEKVDK